MTDKRKAAILAAILIVLCGVLFTYRLGLRGLAEPDEGRYAEVAREMLESGDWMLPRLFHALHMTKPPLTYWLIGGSFSAFGVNEFAARLPSAIAGILTVLSVFYIGSKLWGRTAGFTAALVLMSAPQFFVSARLAFPDMLLTSFATMGFACLIRGHSSEGARWPYLVYWALAGLGMLTKGPVTLVIMLLPVLIYAVLLKDWRLLRSMKFVEGLALFLIVSLPWYIHAAMRLPGLATYFITRETAERLTSTYREVPPFFLVGVLFALSTPWFFYFLAGAARLFSREGDSEDRDQRKIRYLILCWLLAVAVFFSLLRSSIASYILPAYPPLALLAGVFIANHFSKETRSRAFSLASAMTLLLLVCAGCAGIYYLVNGQLLGSYGFLWTTILVMTVMILAVALFSLAMLLTRRRTASFVALVALFPAIFIVLLHNVPEIEARQHTRVKGKFFAEQIAATGAADYRVVMVADDYEDLPFYLKHEVVRLDMRLPDDYPFREHDDRFKDLVRFGSESEKELVEADEQVFFVAKMQRYEEMKERYPGSLFAVAQVKGHVLFSNKQAENGGADAPKEVE